MSVLKRLERLKTGLESSFPDHFSPHPPVSLAVGAPDGAGCAHGRAHRRAPGRAGRRVGACPVRSPILSGAAAAGGFAPACRHPAGGRVEVRVSLGASVSSASSSCTRVPCGHPSRRRHGLDLRRDEAACAPRGDPESTPRGHQACRGQPSQGRNGPKVARKAQIWTIRTSMRRQGVPCNSRRSG